MLRTILAFLEELRQNFRIADAIDIIVIAALLYSVLVWFRQTASRSIVVGVSVVAAIYFVARALDMHMTSLLFHAAFAVVLVVLVVVLQEDIRRVFEWIATLGTRRHRQLSSVLASEAVAAR